ncbi:hypothetical protein KUTeg_012609 [Tegillarca granosa]|uniref:EF-hand domain-containing protein n=1 Tax=Tegillarca granosa TaxID=220873 RepID=A0ABQ9F019_TEGGR|nr:hypothetical protein KUTeg_012609 [Tegillarca granosa]
MEQLKTHDNLSIVDDSMSVDLDSLDICPDDIPSDKILYPVTVKADAAIDTSKDLVVRELTKLEHAKVKRKFNKYDENGDGTINFGEARRHFSKIMSELKPDASVSYKEFEYIYRRYLSTIEYKQAEMRAAFRMFDLDGNGYITKDELKAILCGKGDTFGDQEADELIEEADLNKDGKIDYIDNFITINELELIIRAHVSKIEYEEAQLYAQFQKFDLDGNGKITKDELIHILKNCGKSEEEAEEEAHALISEADDNGDEEIEFEGKIMVIFFSFYAPIV